MRLQIDLFASAAMPIELADKRLHPDERPRLNRQCMEILRLLCSISVPVPNTRLTQTALRYGARIHEIGKAGIHIKIVERNHETGVNEYAFATPEDRKRAMALAESESEVKP